MAVNSRRRARAALSARDWKAGNSLRSWRMKRPPREELVRLQLLLFLLWLLAQFSFLVLFLLQLQLLLTTQLLFFQLFLLELQSFLLPSFLILFLFLLEF